MAKDFAISFYRSRAWRQCRDAYYKARHGLCERCGAGGKIVHHRIELTPTNINDPSVTLNHANLELVCQECHNKTHMGTDATADGLRFDGDGNVIPI